MYHRWAPEMETEHLKVSHWRKSSQWAVLRRDHAHIIADDREVADVFTKHCYMEWRDNVWRDCYSDEHYLGTLLASRVRGNFPRESISMLGSRRMLFCQRFAASSPRTGGLCRLDGMTMFCLGA